MFDTRLKEARILKGYNMKQFAELLDMPYRTYVKYERNEREPNSEVLIKIADALNVTVDYLLGVKSKQEPLNYKDQYILELGLKKLGVSIGFYEEDAMMWLEFPDGTLEISDTDLNDLMQSSLDYLKFKLAELREKRAKDFRKKGTDTASNNESDDSDSSDSSNNEYEIVPIAARGGDGKPLTLKKKKDKSLLDMPDYGGKRK